MRLTKLPAIGDVLIDNDGDISDVTAVDFILGRFHTKYRDPSVTYVDPAIIMWEEHELRYFSLYVEKTVEPIVEYSTTIQSKYKL